MKKLIGSCAAAVMLAGLSMPAMAAYISDSWEDTVWLNSDLEDSCALCEFNDNLVYTHNFNDNGFTPLLDQLTDGWVQITLTSFDGADSADVRFSLLGLSGIGGGGVFSTNVGTFNLTSEGLGILWLTGTITGNIEPITGSFHAVKSVAHLDGWRYVGGNETVGVPEPGSLALLAVGLIGMGAALSRRRSRSPR